MISNHPVAGSIIVTAFINHKDQLTHTSKQQMSLPYMLQPPPPPHLHQLTSRKTRPFIQSENRRRTLSSKHAIKQSRNFSNTQSDINASHYWNHMHNQLVCISCNVKASEWKPGLYNNAMYDPVEDPYNSPLPLQWYFNTQNPPMPRMHAQQ